MTRTHKALWAATVAFGVSALLLWLGVRQQTGGHHSPVTTENDGSRFICSENGEGARVYSAPGGRTEVRPTGWRCDRAEWLRTGRMNVAGGPLQEQPSRAPQSFPDRTEDPAQ